jgi:hypothetical protein
MTVGTECFGTIGTITAREDGAKGAEPYRVFGDLELDHSTSHQGMRLYMVLESPKSGALVGFLFISSPENRSKNVRILVPPSPPFDALRLLMAGQKNWKSR